MSDGVLMELQSCCFSHVPAALCRDAQSCALGHASVAVGCAPLAPRCGPRCMDRVLASPIGSLYSPDVMRMRTTGLQPYTLRHGVMQVGAVCLLSPRVLACGLMRSFRVCLIVLSGPC